MSAICNLSEDMEFPGRSYKITVNLNYQENSAFHWQLTGDNNILFMFADLLYEKCWLLGFFACLLYENVFEGFFSALLHEGFFPL